jgi:hypothetical protein
MSSVAFLDTKAHPSSDDHYAWYHLDVKKSGYPKPTWVPVSRVHACPNMNLHQLLTKMQNHLCFNEDVLLCCHGTFKTLSIPFVAGGKYKVDPESVKYFLSKKPASKEDAAVLGISLKQLGEIKEMLAWVHMRKIGHLAIRACNLGQNELLLEAIKKLFKADSLSAPTKRDAFCPFRPRVARSAKEFDGFVRKHPSAIVTGYAGQRMAVDVTYGAHSFGMDGMGETEDAVNGWIGEKFSPYLPKWKAGQPIYIHALYTKPLSYPRDPDYGSNIHYFERVTDPLAGLDLSKMVY